MKLINDLTRHTMAYKDEIAAAVRRVVDSGWFVLGPENTAFEQEFAAYCGVASCVGVANGTDALELALRALDVRPGDRVAGVANAGGYGLHAIRAVGAVPVFVDVGPATTNMSPEGLAAVLKSGPEIKVVVFTHLYGDTAGIEAVAETCARHRVPLIEDCAQAHGAIAGGRKVGAWGVAGCFSFYPTKNLGALGDGGAVVASDPKLIAGLRELRQYGWGSTKYVSQRPGARNSRLDEMQAAVLRTKLPHLDGWNARRRQIAQRYARGLAGLPLTLPLSEAAAAGSPGYVGHLYVIRTPQREGLREALKLKGIGTDVHYPVPDHRQAICPPEASQRPLPITEKLSTEVLTLPCYPELLDSEVDAVVAAIRGWFATQPHTSVDRA